MDGNSPSNNHRSSNSTPADPGMQTKRCQDCCALLPISEFGLHKRGTDGYQASCKQCRSEYSKFRWTERYGRRNKPHEYDQIRSVSRHNRLILESLVGKGATELRGFDVVTKMEYKVYFGPAERHGMDSLACFTRSGQTYFDYAFSGLKDKVEFLLHNLKGMNVRLEWTDADVITSKQTIYYL